jgi:hypothetical protein
VQPWLLASAMAQRRRDGVGLMLGVLVAYGCSRDA